MELVAAPVSFAQQGLWVQAELEPGNPAYHVPIALKLRGAIDKPALIATLEALAARHEILRTTFAMQGAELMQVIHPAIRIPFREEAIAGDDELARRISEEIHTPFDLVRGPLMRCVLFERTANEAVLLLTMHHLVTDGWSLGVMVRELAALYRRTHLPELEIQYADFAEWQREQADHARLADHSWTGQLAYWKEQLRPPLAAAELATDFPRPSTRSSEGATATILVAQETLDKLRQLSTQTGSTLFMTLLAAFKVLVQRHTGVTDVIVGSPVANRNREEVEALIGFFVNTQILRTSLDGTPTFLQVLERVRETTLGAWENQDLPFEMLTAALQRERKSESNALFQVMFALQNAPRGTLELPGVSIEVMDVVTDTAKFPLTVINEEVPDGLEVRIEYSTALFTRETVLRIARRYERLLLAAVADPSATIDRMPMLPDEERAVIDGWSAAESSPAVADDASLSTLFERQAARTPANIAVTCDGRALTYQQLDARATQLAHHLQSLGVTNETLVGLALDRSLDLVVAIVAILKAGGAYVPLDPSYPASRLQFVIEDSQVPVIITSAAHIETLKQIAKQAQMVDIAAISSPDNRQPTTDNQTSHSAAYVIYTSGSTGKPKGVIVTHANVVRLMKSTESLYDFNERDVWTLFHSYAFDFSVWELWGALLYGGRVVVVPFSTSRTPELFHHLLVAEGVTVLNQTPSAFYQLMEMPAPQSLRYVIFGGEALDIPRLRGWFERHGDAHPQLINMYGITETTVHVTYRPIAIKDTERPGSVIGRAIRDLSIHVLDPLGEVLPIGVAGEMYVGGSGVARGYLRRDELTAARFLDDPARGRLYRTGDLARWLPSGELEYHGRIDTQVKIRGFRIELGEIEHVLRGVRNVHDAVVLLRDGRLIAYVVAATPIATNELREHCERELPDYMVPSAYVAMDAFPLTANGKLDRDALPHPDLQEAVVHEEYVAPQTEAESTLARIWSEVLQVERVGTTDNFFALGGDSILLLQVAAKAAKAGVRLTRRNLVEYQTIRELAALAKQPAAKPIAKKTPEPSAVNSQPATVNLREADAYALTPMQQGLLFHTVFTPEQDFYIEQLHAELAGALDLAAFEKAWQTVIARHAVLRTSFEWQGVEMPRQRVHADVPFGIEVEDWRGIDVATQNERLAQRLADDRARGFDLTRAPLMRVAMFRLADDRWQWLWTHHHLILDGWSLTAVVGEVLACYRAFSRGEQPQLQDRRPYRDYIDWLAQQDAKAAEQYWRETLAGLTEPTRLDTLEQRPSPPAGAGRGELDLSLTPEQTARLQVWARKHQVTLNTLVTAAWAKLLATYSGNDDVVFGVTVSGRPAELTGYEHMVGPFINTLPLRVRLDADAPFDAWLRTLQKQHGTLREYEFSRLVDVQRWSALPAGQTLFDTLLVFENYPVDQSLREHDSGLSFGHVTFVERGHYGLALAAIPGESLALRLYYDGARFDAAAMHRALEQLRTLLDDLDVTTTSKWSALDATERRRLTSHEPASLDERRAHELFEEQAQKTPNAIALTFGDRTMTYAELDARANELAATLQRRGVGPDVIVGIRLDRSFEMIIAVLAVWKAGGAYLPVDPAYPEKRIKQMIEDSGALLVVSDGLAVVEDRLAVGGWRLAGDQHPHHDQISGTPSDRLSVGGWRLSGDHHPHHDDLSETASETLSDRLSVAGCRLSGDQHPHHDDLSETASEAASEPTATNAALPDSPVSPDNRQPPTANQAPANRQPPTANRSAAYVIYTSGSTGTPKATVVEHRALTNLAHALADAFTIDADSRVLQFASLSFDVSVSEIVMALSFGASLHLATRDEVLPGPAFAELLRAQRITHLSIVPTVLAAVPAIPLPDLRCLIVGGEKCPQELLDVWSRGRQIFNCYGPTEATVCTTWSLYDGGELTIGKAIPNARTYVLDRHGEPVPLGVPGELCIGGAGVSRGYLNRPELNAERFIEFNGERVYRTGDLVRESADGSLEFLGRIDQQIKIRGFRIEPGEIAQVLRERGGLRDAVVVPLSGRLVAYGVATGETNPRELRALCEEWLPEHMVPAAYVLLDALPLTPSGKIDRNALPDPDLEHDVVREAFVASRNDTETALAKAWSEVLGLARVGVEDNFFELGGDSILSLQVASKASQAGLAITPRDVFEQPTIAALAKVARTKTTVVASAARASHPSTPIQRWFFEQPLVHRNRWNQSVLLEVDASLDTATLANAIAALANHHDAFRSRFVESAHHYADAQFAFEQVALPADIEAHANRAHASLDLANGPLARAIHFVGPSEFLGVPRVPRSGSLLLVVLHHLIVDGVSWRVLFDDLSRLCRGEQLDPSLSFGEWASRLETFAKTNALDVDYWLALDNDLAPLPSDPPRGTPRNPEEPANPEELNKAKTIDIVELRLENGETDALLRRVPAVYRTQVNDILLAAFTSAMRAWTSRDSVWLNMEGHGRESLIDDLDLSRTVGWFTSLFPVRLHATTDEPGALLRSIKDQLRRIPQNGVGFGIARYLANDARLASLPQPQISFNYLGQFDQAEAQAGLFKLAEGPVGRGQSDDERRLHLLDVVASVQGGQFRVAWHYSTDVHQRATIERLAESFVASLRRIIEHCLRLLGSGVEVEDLYALAPMQQGLLFEALQSRASDLYVEQLQAELRGGLDPHAFERAWQEVVKRHDVFRTSFVWEDLDEPLQRVQREVAFNVDLHDWRDVDDVEARLESYLRNDRERGIALDRAPLFRVALLRVADERWHLVWTHHHILLDGWCMSLVVREVLECYEGITKRTAPKLRRSRPYRDYIDWLAKQDVEAARKYWTRTLAGFTEPTRLQLIERGAEAPVDSGEVDLHLSAVETRRLQSWTRRQHITLNTLVVGAWARLLQTVSGSNDVVFGVTVSGRPASLAGSEEMIGLFINTLPMRAGDGRGAHLLDWLQSIQSRQTELRDYEYSRLVDVQRCSDVPAGQPLFETLLAFDNYPVDKSVEQRFGDLEIHDARLAERTNYPLAVSVVPSDELRIRALYDAARFSEPTIRQLLGSLRTLLLTAASDDVASVDAWTLVTREERASLLTRAGVEPPPVIDECLGDWFARVAAEHPDNIAVTFEGRDVTYAELDARADALAVELQAHGVGPETLVGLCVPRSIELVVGILGILKAGGAYVPLDPSYPSERLRYVIEDSATTIVVTTSTEIDKLKRIAPQAKIVDLTALVSPDNRQPTTDNQSPINRLPSTVNQAANAAYVIYTSGSTGNPKGCVVTHANVSRLMKQTEPLYSFDASDVWTLFHSAAFDFSVWELWGALLYGGRLVIVPYATSRSPEEFYDLLQRERVTVLNQTPSAFRQLMAVDEARRAKLELRFVIFGGEALQLDSLRTWFERHGDAHPLLVNMYGITETTVHVTYRAIRLEDLGSGSRIGTPIADLKLYVLDAYQQLVPEGVTGELYVAGAGLSRGYLHRPELTAERMVLNPFGPGRLYKTGDLARWRGNDLEYLGRADEQVKVRGFRIEVGEIESVLAQHPLVREVLVLLETLDDDKRLVAYLVGRAPVTIDELRAFLGERIPDYMIPAAFVVLDAMPLTANGKINRAALPMAGAVSAGDYSAPRTDAERALAEIWSEVLGADRVGIDDNFFSLGGDSIRSIRILSMARARGFDYSFQQLFEYPTIAELVAHTAPRENPEEPEEPEELRGTPRNAYPLTRLQQGMFFYSDFESGATAYHDVMSYHLRAPYDAQRLVESLATLTARHAILRTSFDFTTYAEPMQLVHRDATIPFDETDLRGVIEKDAAIRAWAEHERRTPFAPDAAPLLRVRVHRRTDDEFQFNLSFHHAILDGWSVASMLTELFRIYLQLPVDAAPERTFRDFVELERRAVADVDSRAFWTSFLEDAPFAELPRLQFAPSERTVRQQLIAIDDATSRAIRKLADDAGVPLRSALLAAHLRALSHITNHRDVVTGLVTNGRPEDADGDRVLGLFLNTVPFRARVDGGTWLDLVRETFRTEQRVSAHRRYPLAEIQKATGGAPLFETDFNFVHFHIFDQIENIAGVQSLGAEGFEETNFTIAVNFSLHRGGLSGALDYDTSLLTSDQAAEYARIYTDVLDAMAAHPVAIAAHPVAIAAHPVAIAAHPVAIAAHPRKRYEQIALTSFDATFETRDLPPLALHELVAPASPLIAAREEGHALTYAQLHARSNQLAHALLRAGVTPDTLVGVALDPGVDRVIALLAILKAGGAYVPLDPEYPAQRLAMMIEDSAMRILIARDGRFETQVSTILDVEHPHESTSAPIVNVSPDNLAYALFTSGSTGRPKGVLIPHRAIVNHMLWMQRAYPLATDDIVFQKTPFSFDASVWEFWAPLIAGASMFVAKTGGQQDPAYLIDAIRTRRLSILQVVPTLLEALLAEPAFAECRSLRRVFVGGEALSTTLVQRFHEALPHAELINLYGPTEATIEATSHRFAFDEAMSPIGAPITNARTYVLNDALQFVPVGTEGELYIAGEGIGRGYLERSAMTAASFVPDPHGEPGMRMYRTGDRARWLPGGVLEFRGRADEQVKLRGYRVELGEIEAALASHEGVQRAVAIAHENRLVAYIVAERPVEHAKLRAHLLRTLPEHMVPAVFIPLSELPLTPSGKIDRKALPKPEAQSAATRGAYVAPTTEVERALATAWESIFGMREVGIDDNFFELGGDSILSLRIVSRVRQAGWKISPKQILQHQTIARVAEHAERIGSARTDDAQLTGEVPLSPIQHAFFELDLPNPNHWNQSVMLEVPPDFSLDAFRVALDAVAHHHDAFRLRFTRNDDTSAASIGAPAFSRLGRRLSAGLVLQTYAEPSPIPLDETADVEQIQRSLDITHGPLMSAAFFDNRLLLVAHHLIIDGVSWRILFEDLASAYEQAKASQPSPDRLKPVPPQSVAPITLPAKSASVRTWVEQLASHTPNPRYWLALARANIQSLPANDDANLESDARSVVTQLTADETRNLRSAQLTDVLLTALVETITDWTGGDTLWLDLEGHGREDLFDNVDVSRTVGWFTSLFPVALARNGERGTELLKSIKTQLRAVPNKGLDYGVLRYLSSDASIRERLAALPPREISFNYLGRFDEQSSTFRAASEPTGSDHDPGARRGSLIDVNARIVNGQLAIEWHYASRAFDAGVLERLANAFVEHVRALADSDIEDVLPLSPLQEGLLFHALDDEQVYLQQISMTLDGTPNPRAFERAWNRTIERHSILRTSFHRRELQRPLQIVHPHATCAIAWLDWRAMPVDAREEAWDALLRGDRRSGIDLERAPVMRVTMMREDDARWRMLWTHHHLVLDGWSLPIVLQDVVAFYREESQGVPARRATAPPYARFIEWLESRDAAEAEAYWREALRGFDHPNEIATSNRGTNVASRLFDEIELELTNDQTARLSELAQASRVTLNTIVQSLWALLLATYSRQRDVVFGVTVSGRPAEIAGIDQTAGLFINTLPLRVPVAAEATLGDFIVDVQRRQAAMSQFEFSRLVDVQQWSDVPRGRALFDSIVVFENYPLGDSLDDAPLADFTVQHARSVEWTHYPLTLFVTPGRSLRIKLVYRTDRFEANAMQRMLGHARAILEAFDPATHLGRLATDPHASSIVIGESHPIDGYFHERFAAQAARTPDAIAIVCGEESITYRDLDERASQLAAALHIELEDIVGLYVDRSIDMMVAMLATLKAGGAYLPLDPRFPSERLAMMIEDAAPAVIVVGDRLAEDRLSVVGCRLSGDPRPAHVHDHHDLHDTDGAPASAIASAASAPTLPSDDRRPKHTPRVLTLNAPVSPDNRQPTTDNQSPDNLAYVIFTSGSTGRPKGVQISHRALTNLLQSFEREPGMTANDVMLAVTTLSFDIAALELDLPLMVGAKLIIATADDAADGDRLAALLAKHNVTIMQATPATWRLLLVSGWTPPSSLRIWCGGEALPPDLAGALRIHGSELWNVYGPTETTIWSAIHPIHAADDARSIGAPIANTTMAVVDENLQLLPLGVPGELLIGGAGVARGYRNQPMLSAERFVLDPFTSTPGARAYRTGDLVRLRDDRTFEFLGRIDTQVKVRGFRVELGEIETVLRNIAEVRDAAVVLRDERLIAYVVRDTRPSRPPRELDDDLVVRLSATLPDYMVPRIYVDLDALPLTPNGKIDRKALPNPERVADESTFVAPRNAVEEVLADVWQQTLGLPRVGVHDNFFTIGGHSLHAAQIVAWLRRAFRAQIPLRVLFEATTIEQLAHVLAQQPVRVQQTAEAILKIKWMSPEERARRLEQRQARREESVE